MKGNVVRWLFGVALLAWTACATAQIHPVYYWTSGTWAPSFGPENAFDGSLVNYWNAGGAAPQWIQVDLGADYRLGKIRLLTEQVPDGITTHAVWGRDSAGN